MSSHIYNDALLVISPLLALAFWAIVVFMALDGYRRQTWRKHAFMWFWCLNVAAWWTVGASLRIFDGYVGPGVFLSFWGTVIYIQAALSLLAWFILARNNTLPTGPPTIYPTEFGPDDD